MELWGQKLWYMQVKTISQSIKVFYSCVNQYILTGIEKKIEQITTSVFINL